MWMLRGWRTQQGRGHGSVDGVEVEGAAKRDEVAVGHGASIGRRQEMK